MFANRELLLHGRKGHRLLPAVRVRTCARRDADNLCRINPVKPDKCRTFPQSWVNPDSASVCPALRDILNSR